MPLESQVVDVKFVSGQDTRTQRKLVLPGKWDTLVNYALSEDNTPRRRDGAQALIGTQNGNGLALHNNELLTIAGGTVSTVEATTPTGALAKTVPGELPYVDIAKTEVDFTSGNHDSLDVAYGNGFACYVWRDLTAGMTVNGIKCTVVDVASGAKMVNAATIVADTTAVSPRVVFAGGAFFITEIEPGVGIDCTVILTSAPSTVGARTNIVVDANVSGKNNDACVFNGQPLVIYGYTDGVTSVKSMLLTNVGTTPSIATGPFISVLEVATTLASIQAMTCAVFSATRAGIFIVHTAGGAVAAGLVGATLDAALNVTTATVLIDATVPPVASATHVTATLVDATPLMQVFTDQQSSYNSANLRPIRSVTVSSTMVAVFASTIMRSATYVSSINNARGPQGPFIAGKAFSVGTSTFLPIAMLENYITAGAVANEKSATLSSQCSFFLLDTAQLRNSSTGVAPVVAGALYRVLGLVDTTLNAGPPTVQTPCSVVGPTSTGNYLIALQQRGLLDLMAGVNDTPVGAVSIAMTPRTTTGAVSASLGESTYLAGGQLANCDGSQAIQHGFPNFPEGIIAIHNATGLGALTQGVHQVVAVYEWVDGGGNRHQSAPSIPVNVNVVNATDQIDVTIPTTQLPQMAGYDVNLSTLTIVCYMTTAAGLTFFRTSSGFATPTPNNVAASTVTFTIGTPVQMSDNVLGANEILYTQPLQAGTTLPTIAPGPVSACCAAQDRLLYLEADQPFRVGLSQALLPNTGLQFSEALSSSLPVESGGGVAVAMLDEKQICFGRRRIYVRYGNPPDASGANNGLSQWQDIQADVGCSDARSVLSETPDGIIFKAQQGWHLLGRDLSVKYIGAGVAAYDQYAVNSAVLMGDRKEARFALGKSTTDDTIAGATLIYSTLVNEWSVTIYGANLLHGNVSSDAAWWPALNRYVHINTTEGLSGDVLGAINDSWGTGPSVASFYGLARTAFLKLGPIEGFQRVRRLYLTASGAASVNSTMAIQVFVNDSYSTVAYTVTPISTLALATAAGNVDAIDLRHKIASGFQKCKSIAFFFVDIPPNDATSSGLLGIQALALEIGIKRGVRKLPAGATVG